jgi:hypothetical protein
MVGSVSNRQNTIELEINNISKSMIGIEEAQQIKTDLEEIKTKLSGFKETLSKFADEQIKIRDTNSMEFEAINQRILELSKIKQQVPESQPKIKAQGVMTLDDSEEGEKAEPAFDTDLSDEEMKIIYLIPEKGFTKNRIIKELEKDFTTEIIEECLQSLMDKNVLSTEKRGRHTIYIKTETNGGVK